jgi:hypothetical protein
MPDREGSSCVCTCIVEMKIFVNEYTVVILDAFGIDVFLSDAE